MLQPPGTGSKAAKIRLNPNALLPLEEKVPWTGLVFTGAEVGEDQAGAGHRRPVRRRQEPGRGHLGGLQGRQEPRVQRRQEETGPQNLNPTPRGETASAPGINPNLSEHSRHPPQIRGNRQH